MKKYIFFILLALLSIILFHFKILDITQLLLALTGIIVFWYTYETSILRKHSQENLNKGRRPIVGFNLSLNSDNYKDIQFQIINHSSYPVSCLIKLKIKVFGKYVDDIWDDYDGKRFWNIEVNQAKFGHFGWLQLMTKADIYKSNVISKITEQSVSQIRDKIYEEIVKSKSHSDSTINFELQVFSFNEFGFYNCYPKFFYNLRFDRFSFVAGITSNKPYLNYNYIPDWLDFSLLPKNLITSNVKL